MAFSTKLQIIDAKMVQPSGGTLTLSGDTTVANSGDLRYATHPTFVDDEEIIDKKYVDDNIVSGGTYNLDSPSTVDVGGLDAGSTLTGLTSNEILEDILVPYLAPTFSSFAISGQDTTVEVGTSISGLKTFTWATTQSGNVASNSIYVYDTDSGTPIGGPWANDGNEAANVGTINFTANGQQESWYGRGTDTLAATFDSSNFTVTSYHPYYWGKEVGAGAAGDNRPTATNALVTGGTKVLANSNGTITINFSSASNEYIWFAIPDTSTAKTVWYETEINQGTIGGAATTGPTDLGPNLFPTAQVILVSSALWSNVNYKVYIANWQSAAGTFQLKNS